MLKFKLAFRFSFLCFISLNFLYASEKKQPLSDLYIPKEKKTTQENLLDYSSLVKEVVKIRKSLNQLKVSRELEYLSQEIKGKAFLIKGTVEIKRDSLVGDGDRLTWITPHQLAQTKVSFKRKYASAYDRIEEFDFIHITATLLKIDRYIEFEFLEEVKIEPFDSSADFVDYNEVMDSFFKGEKKGVYQQNRAQHLLSKHNNKLGYVSAKVTSITDQEKFILVKLSRNHSSIEVLFHKKHSRLLSKIELGHTLNMALRLQNIDPSHTFYFTRGCLIE